MDNGLAPVALAPTPSQEVAIPETIVSINPTEYVAAVYAPFMARVKNALEATNELIVDGQFQRDITTGAGLKVATEARALWKKIRTEADAERKGRKAPILEIGKLLDEKAKGIAACAQPREQWFDALIEAEENRKTRIREERERIERERIEKIQTRIADIRFIADAAEGKDSTAVQAAHASLSAAADAAFDYQEFSEQFVRVVAETGQRIDGLLAAAQAREERARQEAEARRIEDQRIAEERAELKRLREEQAQMRAQLAAAQAQAAPTPPSAPAGQNWATKVERAIESPVAAEVRAAAEPAPVLVLSSNAPIVISTKAAPRPSGEELISVLADVFGASPATVIDWLADLDLVSLNHHFAAH